VNEVFPPDTEIMMRIAMNGSVLTSQGKVRWARMLAPSGIVQHRCRMGVEFTYLSDPFQEFLKILHANGHQDRPDPVV
jgi:hypothetical protein